MKRQLIFAVALFSFVSTALFAQTESTAQTEETATTTVQSTIPAARRPRKPTQDELLSAAEKDETHNTDEYINKCNDTFAYGLESEISDLIDELTKNEDMRFVDAIYDLFHVTKSPTLKQKVLAYFTKL